MNDYDKAIRAAIKRLDPAGFLAWLFFDALDPDVRWRELVDRQPDRGKKGEYAVLTTTLAEKRNRGAVWHKATEGMTMGESLFLREMTRRAAKDAKEEGMRTLLLDTLELRFQGKPPADIVAALEGIKNADELRQWQRHALTSDSFDSFRTKIIPANGPSAS